MSDTKKGLSDEAIDALRKEHGGVFVHRIDDSDEGECVVFKRPTPLQYKAWRTESDNEKNNGVDVAATFAEKIVVHPDKAAWAALREKYAGLSELIAAEGGRVSRGMKTAFAKKALPPSSTPDQ